MCGGNTVRDALTWPLTDTLFPTAPETSPLPKSPSATDPAVQAAMEKERELARTKKGRSGTILTSALGLPDTSGLGKKTSFLGGGGTT